ncbi:hypothetical protein like AT3G24255 [Hibiscus trionum]|uniref:Reverse transcriptase zinc-binding domain-containing protein n=1 Tax=Hibiscus trionum TaxID=183268 RepID=A0A9W7I4A2_HIBTR|nr:hypothetical protein like AT3G24255 [Hibiscus trionum]
MERLAHSIEDCVVAGRWKPVHLSRNGPGISHLFFADDLVLFAEASPEQLALIKGVLEDFCLCSGHRVSVAKTQIYFSKNCLTGIRDLVGVTLGFEVVEDLGKYLGVPLLHSRVTKSTYAYVLANMRRRLSGWVAQSLSLAGRVTLAKSVLQAILSYVIQATWLPKGLCKEMEKLIRRFVWGGSDEKRGVSLVSWDVMQQPMEDGGMGMKDLGRQNEAFLMKVGFELVMNSDKLWVRVLRDKYSWQGGVPASITRGCCSRLWRGLSRVWEAIKSCVCWNVRDGETTDLWYDVWLGNEGPLSAYYVLPGTPPPTKVAAMVTDEGGWNWNLLNQLLPPSIVQLFVATPPPRSWFGSDCPGYRWTDNMLCIVRSAYSELAVRHEGENQRMWKLIWALHLPNRVKMFLWLVLRKGLLTNMERQRRHMCADGTCAICQMGQEDIDHVLRRCPFARQV